VTDPNLTGRLVTAGDLVLVVVDVQDGLAAVMHRRNRVVRMIATLARAAAIMHVPIIVTRQYPKGLGDVVPELGGLLDSLATADASVTIVDKIDFDCSAEPAFASALEATGRSHVALVGMETHICVTQTALSLAAGEHTSHVVADAVCSRRDEDHDVSLARLRSAGVDVLPSESVIYEALGRAGTADFRAVLGVVKGV
jgi:nicotinamidase-related amidase